MRVIICGAGQVGSGIARQLAAEGNAVTVIDQSAPLIRQITEELDVQGIIGHGAYPEILDRAGARDADMLIAVTHSDEVNIVACEVANSLFNVTLKIARIRAQSYLNPEWQDLFSRDNLAIDVTISPELEVARSVLRRLHLPGSFDVVEFSEGRVQLVGVRCETDCPILNTPLRQLTELFPDLRAIVVGVTRNGRFFVPEADDTLSALDDVYFVAAREDVPRTLDVFGHQEREARRVIVVGAGHIGLFVASSLEHSHPAIRLRLIEADKGRAEEAAEALTRALVLHGDGVDEQVLTEAGVADAEAMVALTNDDDVNIVTSVLAKQAGAKRVLALTNKPTYGRLARTLGIDASINPRATTVSTIMQHVRRGRIKGLHSIEEGAAEVIEAEALDTSPLVGKQLRDARISAGIIVGAIVRDGKVLKPRGSMTIETHDRVVMLARRDMIRKVEQLFRVSLDYF